MNLSELDAFGGGGGDGGGGGGSSTWNKIAGGAGVVMGVAMIGTSMMFAASTGGLGGVVGVAGTMYGIDYLQASWRQMESGEETQTYTGQGLQAISESKGFSKSDAKEKAETTEMYIQGAIGVMGMSNGYRVMSSRLKNAKAPPPPPAPIISPPAPSAPSTASIGRRIAQTQNRHLEGTVQNATNGGGYMNSIKDAQTVLNAVHSGEATYIGVTTKGWPIYRYTKVTGINVNKGVGIINQPTNVFIIKGTTSPSVVPTNPFHK